MKPLLGPRSLNPHRINRDTPQEPIGEKLPTREANLAELERFVMSDAAGMIEGRHALLVEAAASPFDDMSPFFARARELGRQHQAEVERRRAASQETPLRILGVDKAAGAESSAVVLGEVSADGLVTFGKWVTPDGKPAETRLDYLRRELRENTTLALGECDLVARYMDRFERGIAAYSYPGILASFSLAIEKSLTGGTATDWTYRDRNGVERRIAILDSRTANVPRTSRERGET